MKPENPYGDLLPQTDEEWRQAFCDWSLLVGDHYTTAVVQLAARISHAMAAAGLLDVPGSGLTINDATASMMARATFVANEAMCELGLCQAGCRKHDEMKRSQLH